MDLLSKLKSFLGLGGSGGRRERETSVTVEREPSAPAERAVSEPGSDAEAEPTGTAATGTAAEPATGDDAGTDSGVEIPDLDTDAEPEPDEPAIEEAEPDEVETDVEEAVADLEAVEAEEDVDVGEAEEQEAAAGDEGGAAEAVEGGDDPVDTVSGIGPAYAERLAGAGVETVADLLAADPESLSDEIDVSASRIETWMENARGD